MKYALFIAFALSFGSCTNGIDLDVVFYDSLLNDNNSKVWVVNSFVVGGMDVSNPILSEKNIIVFHANNTVNMLPMKGIGSSNPKRGRYILDSKNKELVIDFGDSQWDLDINYITEDSIYFSTKEKVENKFGFQIIPFPKL